MAWVIWPELWYLDVGVLLVAVAIDLIGREPPNIAHPVAWMGKVIALLEQLSPRSGTIGPLSFGVLTAVAVPMAFGLLAWLAVFGLRELGAIVYIAGGGLMLKTTFSVKGLHTAALNTGRALERDVVEARHSLRNLVSRDAETLSPPLVAAAAVESVAENSTDSYIGPWIAFAALGIPGAFAYRAINTLDSMLGYHGRYEYIGKASARLDDLINLIPARLTGGLIIVAGAITGLNVGRGWNVMWSDHGKTESPNAGWTMCAMSGLLGVVLEKPGHYRLGDGLPQPESPNIAQAVRVGYVVAALGVAIVLSAIVLRSIFA